jgi:hypothetical protein
MKTHSYFEFVLERHFRWAVSVSMFDAAKKQTSKEDLSLNVLIPTGERKANWQNGTEILRISQSQ